MKASEAITLTQNAYKSKDLISKIRLAWYCGILNSKIKHNAKAGAIEARIQNVSRDKALRYFPFMAECYENEGYFVLYQNDYSACNDFKVVWDLDKYLKMEKCIYDYHTKVKNNKLTNC